MTTPNYIIFIIFTIVSMPIGPSTTLPDPKSPPTRSKNLPPLRFPFTSGPNNLSERTRSIDESQVAKLPDRLKQKRNIRRSSRKSSQTKLLDRSGKSSRSTADSITVLYSTTTKRRDSGHERGNQRELLLEAKKLNLWWQSA
ncbi:hypothetical protein BKA61DRAFT_603751 [Leptodontidium sp. MPI-SDFR-AT-0119]|nr:hypothetical protein BKA61DRAFT_603751 [Leptodontidium sp. MPI-SDFR-AT-0119]